MNLRDGHSEARDSFPLVNQLASSAEAKITASGQDPPLITTEKGRELQGKLKEARGWKERFQLPTQEFCELFGQLYGACQEHLTQLSAKDTSESRMEADALVDEMIALRNHWGRVLLPLTVCDSFVRETIVLNEQYRIACAQFFEPVPFYENRPNKPELMKLYRFSVYDVSRNEVVLRYHLERSNFLQLYHVLCFTAPNVRGQIHPYGPECPSYWIIREHMLADIYARLKHGSVSGIAPSGTVAFTTHP